jgi:hypothetical protein
LAPLTLEVTGTFDASKALFSINYDASDPAGVNWNSELGQRGLPAHPGPLRIWNKDAQGFRNPFAPVIPYGNYIAPGVYTAAQLGLTNEDREAELFVEAVKLDPAAPTRTIRVQVDPDGAALPAPFSEAETIQVKLASFDLDIDSDNNNLSGAFPDRSNWEETLEVHPYALGKLIMLDNPTRPVTPVVVQLPAGLNPNDTSLRVRMNWVNSANENVKLWTTAAIDSARNTASVDLGGHQVLNGIAFLLDDLGYDPGTGEIFLYAEGTLENPLYKTLAGVETNGKPDKRLTATFEISGRKTISDEVKYVVANEDSFFYHLQTRPEVRSALASRGAYEGFYGGDLKSFSLKALSRAELAVLGVPADIRELLGPYDGITGFEAVLYQDFLAGDNRYILAFGGTDSPLTAEGMADWIENNIPQAVGFDAEQYAAAMLIANQLLNLPLFTTTNVTAAGHSLGGGLASAASVVTGIHAYTFNAAGLHIETLYDEGVEIYAGSVTRYNNASTLIDAHYVDWDVLSFVQDESIVFLPSALGSRHEMDGPYDLELSAMLLLFAVPPPYGVMLGVGGGGYLMLKSHLADTAIYALLQDGDVDVSGYDL